MLWGRGMRLCLPSAAGFSPPPSTLTLPPAVAAALGALPWPVYQCTRPLLAAVAEEAVRRQCLAQPEGRTALDAALASARALSPSFSADLEAQVAVWRAQGRAAAGNSIVRAPPREAVPASASR